jgi:cytochrome c-type biogenesis protein CcmH/NrfF
MLRGLSMMRGWKKALQGLVLCVLAVGMLGAGDATSRFNKIGHELMCACGCGQILVECNHVGCPDSDRMLGELRQQLAEGGTDISIENWFVGKYGAVILAAPMRGGFDRVAWITPIAVFVLAIVATVMLVRIWRRRAIMTRAAGGGAAVIQDPAVRERIRRETEWK